MMMTSKSNHWIIVSVTMIRNVRVITAWSVTTFTIYLAVFTFFWFFWLFIWWGTCWRVDDSAQRWNFFVLTLSVATCFTWFCFFFFSRRLFRSCQQIQGKIPKRLTAYKIHMVLARVLRRLDLKKQQVIQLYSRRQVHLCLSADKDVCQNPKSSY